MAGLDRREFLRTMAGSAAGIALSCGAVSQASATAKQAASSVTPLVPLRLSDNLLLVTGAGGNVTVLTTAEGTILFDGGLGARTDELLQLVARETGGQPVKTLFNTHWHWDHTGSNERLAEAGATIIAHENTRLWLGADIIVEWENRSYPARPAKALPTRTFYTAEKIVSGKHSIEYAYAMQAHTDGDLYVFLPEENVLVVGDLLAVGQYPILDYSTGGWIGGLQEANKVLLTVGDESTRIIPGTGPVQTRSDLQAQYDMLATLKDRFWQLIRKGMSASDILAEGATSEFDTRLGSADLFVRNAYKGMWGHARELGGIV